MKVDIVCGDTVNLAFCNGEPFKDRKRALSNGCRQLRLFDDRAYLFVAFTVTVLGVGVRVGMHVGMNVGMNVGVIIVRMRVVVSVRATRGLLLFRRCLFRRSLCAGHQHVHILRRNRTTRDLRHLQFVVDAKARKFCVEFFA